MHKQIYGSNRFQTGRKLIFLVSLLVAVACTSLLVASSTYAWGDKSANPNGSEYGNGHRFPLTSTPPPPPLLPATYYGPIASSAYFTPTPGITMTAWISGNLCSRAQTQETGGQIVYTIKVQAEGGGITGCGALGRIVTFKVGSQLMAPTTVWDNSQVWELPLRPIAPPIAADDTITTPEDTPVAIGVLNNDGDPDAGDVLAVVFVSAPTHGNAVISGTATIVYTPVLNFNGNDAFTYTISDADSLTDTAWVTVTVTPVNDPPVAVDDTASTPENTSRIIAVLGNDTDPDGDTLLVAAVGAPANGTTSTDGATVTYTPTPGFSGTDVFTYTTSDGSLTDTARVTVTVGAVNAPPNAVDDTASTDEDVPVSINVLANDTDPDGGPLVVAAVSAPAHGATATDGSTVTYTPTLNFNGTDVFTYTVSDGSLADAARVTVTVSPVNDPPVAGDDTASTPENTPRLIAVLGNDTDPDGDALSVIAVGTPASGTTSTDGTTVTYTPAPGFSGPDVFTYTISDGNLFDTARVTVTVGVANNPPDAVDDMASTVESVPVLINVLDNDTDPDGDTLFVVAVGTPMDGATGTNGNTVTYTPTLGFSGPDVFTYTASDGSLADTARVTITVTPVNNPPVAHDDTATTAENTPRTIAVLGNDTDPDGDTLFVAAVRAPANGTTSTDGATVTYTPALGFSGLDVFTYTASDGSLADTAKVTVTVGVANNPPDAVNDTTMTDEDVPVLVTVLANDTDPDGDTLFVAAVGTPAHGATGTDGKAVTYTPMPNFNGTDVFTYTASDGDLVDTARVTVTVTPVNNPPIAGDDTASTSENTPRVIAVLGNDTDPDDDPLVVAAVGPPDHGTTSTDGNIVTYTPTLNYIGADVFTYTVSDGNLFDTARVTVTVGVANNPPNVVDDTASTDEDVPVLVTVLVNDTDPDGDTLVVASVSAPDHGTTGTDGKAVTYAPTLNFNGPDVFTYTVSDGDLVGTARVTVTVAPVNDPPTISTIPDQVTFVGTPVGPIPFTVGDVETPAGELGLSAASSNLALVPTGQILLGGTGTARDVTITPAGGVTGVVAITITVDDGTDTASNAFRLTVGKKPWNTVYLPVVLRNAGP